VPPPLLLDCPARAAGGLPARRAESRRAGCPAVGTAAAGSGGGGQPSWLRYRAARASCPERDRAAAVPWALGRTRTAVGV